MIKNKMTSIFVSGTTFAEIFLLQIVEKRDTIFLIKLSKISCVKGRVLMKLTKKIISLVLVVAMLCATLAIAASAANNKPIPSIIVPGIFQSETKYYEDGKATDLEAPFFMGDTMEIVGVALTDALIPISKLLISQEDKDQQAAKALSGISVILSLRYTEVIVVSLNASAAIPVTGTIFFSLLFIENPKTKLFPG